MSACITVDKDKRIYKIDTPNTSYVLGIFDDEGFPGHIYYGERIPDTDVAYLARCSEYAFMPSVNPRDRSSFMDRFAFEYPGNGVGDFREGAILVKDAKGHECTQLTFVSDRIYDGKPELKGLPQTFGYISSGKTKNDKYAHSLELELADPVTGLRVFVTYSVYDDSDAIVRSVRIINSSPADMILEKAMSFAMDMDSDDYELITLHGSWARERMIDRRPIGYGKTSVGSIRGESSHQEHPFMALVSKDADQDRGNAYGFSFVYSGNFLAQVEKSQFDSLRVMMGINPHNFEWRLGPGEEFPAPEVVSVYSHDGIGGMTRSFHDLFRNHLIRSPYLHRERPILINNWEATYFDFNTDKLIAIAKEAKARGIEMLVMDDGWFGKRDDDNSGLGDWTVNEKKLPGGLKRLVSEVNKIGLKFGIWMEPEMVSPDSDLYRAHPEWAIAVPDRDPCRARNQYVLDLSDPEVEEYVWNAISSVLHSANIEYLKWDMNRQLTDLGSACLSGTTQGELSHRYMLAVYRLQERLVNEFPELLLENCSGGGARFDPGMLYYGPQIWCSDDTDAIERLKIQEGTAIVYPLCSMGAHVSDCPNHALGRITPFETRGHVALAGTFGYELDITGISERERDLIPEQVKDYHRFSGLVRDGDYYRLASYSENGMYDCWEVASKDGKEALITYVQVPAKVNAGSRRIFPKGLCDDKKYIIKQIFPDEKQVFPSEKDGENDMQPLAGETLMKTGILIKNQWGDYKSVLLQIIQA